MPKLRVYTSRLSILIAGAVVSAVWVACADAPPTEPAAGPRLSADASGAQPEDALQRLGRGIAVALEDSSTRMRLLEDLRDAPFSDHSVDLQSYLRGPRGALLLANGEGRLGVPVGTLVTLLDSVAPMQLWVPSAYQRATWTGDRDVAVFATASSVKQLLKETRYAVWRPDGSSSTLVPWQPLTTMLVVLAPHQWSFGPDPERTRAQAPKLPRRTIGRRGETSISPLPAAPVPGTGSKVRVQTTCDTCAPPPTYGYGIGASWTACSAPFTDVDQDGFADDCEYTLAYMFRPQMLFSADETLSNRQSYWAVHKYGSTLHIFYALAYNWDYDHPGDSEFIRLTVGYAAPDDRWYLVDATYSAHWRAPWPFDATQTYYSGFESVDSYLGAPRAYPSSGKHANFKSFNDCAARAFEGCNRPVWPARIDVLSSRNLGEPGASLVDWAYSANPQYPGIECFWCGNNFGGWTNIPTSTTGYRTILDYWYD